LVGGGVGVAYGYYFVVSFFYFQGEGVRGFQTGGVYWDVLVVDLVGIKEIEEQVVDMACEEVCVLGIEGVCEM